MRTPVLLVCSIVLLGHGLTASGTIFGSDGGRRFQVTKNLVERGRVDIETSDRAPIGIDGKQYTQYAIGHSLLMVPAYILGKGLARLVPGRGDDVIEFCASLVNLVITVVLVGLLVVFAHALGFAPRTSVALGLIYGFATMAWQQAKDSLEHPQVALYFTLLLYALHRFSVARRTAWLWIAGITLGMAVLTRYSAALAGGAVAAFLLLQARRLAPEKRLPRAAGWFGVIACAALPFLAFDLWYNSIRFGDPLETGQQQLFGSLLAPEGFLRGLWGLSFQWEHGLFVFNPVLLLCFAGIPMLYRLHRDLTVALLVLTSLHIAFYAMTKEVLWTGGWAWGPRLIYDVFPALAVLCAPILEGLRPSPGTARPRRWGVALLVAVSFLVQVESVLVNHHRGCAQLVLGLNGHVAGAHGFRESLLFIQAENVLEIGRRAWRGEGPSVERMGPTLTASSLDETLTMGTFQMWWVYALHLGVAKGWVIAFLGGTLLLLALAIRALVRSLRAEAAGA